jgi:autotransporter passenger strand-loop-strand repeat protein
MNPISGQFTVGSGQTSVGLSVVNSGVLDVLGTVSGTMVSSGGLVIVDIEGQFDAPTLSGTAINTTVSSSGQIVVPSTPEGAPTPALGERSGAPSGLCPSSFVMCNTPVEVQFTSAGCLNYPCRTPQIVVYGVDSGTTVLNGGIESIRR